MTQSFNDLANSLVPTIQSGINEALYEKEYYNLPEGLCIALEQLKNNNEFLEAYAKQMVLMQTNATLHNDYKDYPLTDCGCCLLDLTDGKFNEVFVQFNFIINY